MTTTVKFNFDQNYFNLKFDNGNWLVVTVVGEGECGNGAFCRCGKFRMLTSHSPIVEYPNTEEIQDTINQLVVLNGKIKSLNGKAFAF